MTEKNEQMSDERVQNVIKSVKERQFGEIVYLKEIKIALEKTKLGSFSFDGYSLLCKLNNGHTFRLLVGKQLN